MERTCSFDLDLFKYAIWLGMAIGTLLQTTEI
jgi:hypothetical protein